MTEKITHSIVVRAAIDDLFHIWSNFEAFPHFMKHIKTVRKLDERTSQWVMQGPLGATLEWEAETTRREPNQAIAWNSKDNSAVTTSGQVTFRELGPNETEVNLVMTYDPPAGLAGELATLLSNPQNMVKEDLRRFKEYVESTPERLQEGGQAVDPDESAARRTPP